MADENTNLSEMWEGGFEQLVSHSNEAVIENVIPNEGDGDTPNAPPTYSDHSYSSSNTEMRTRSLPASTLIRAAKMLERTSGSMNQSNLSGVSNLNNHNKLQQFLWDGSSGSHGIRTTLSEGGLFLLPEEEAVHPISFK